MPLRSVSALVLILAATTLAVIDAAAGSTGTSRTTPVATNTTPPDHLLLPAPEAGGPERRGIVVNDPAGQVERIAATGHLLAWSVRSPADEANGIDPERGGERPRPIVFPTSSKVLVADERGGTPLTIELGARWVAGMRMLRGSGGPGQPQLAVDACSSRKRASCVVTLYTLTPADPVAVTAASRPGPSDAPLAEAAYGGSLDSGRRLIILPRPRRSRHCVPRLAIRDLVTGDQRTLPRVPVSDPDYRTCVGLDSRLVVGRYAFATVQRDDRADDFQAWFVYGIDTEGGPDARWHEVYRPIRITAGSYADDLGPAVADAAIVWEENDEDGTMYSLERFPLPGVLASTPSGDRRHTTSAPVDPGGRNACALVATDGALYELANPRCDAYDDGTGTAGEIRRIVHPAFHVAADD